MLSNYQNNDLFQPHGAVGTSINSIRGKAVVIVGSAASINQVTASLLAEQGAPIFLAAHTKNELCHALAVIAKAGGEGDGMVIDLCSPENISYFFDQATYWLGKIDAVVSYLPLELDLNPGTTSENCLNLVMREAIHRMEPAGQGHFIHVGTASIRSSADRNTTAELRRRATELGIRVTLIQPGMLSRYSVNESSQTLAAEDVAQCVLDSLSQPFGMDVIFLKGQLPTQLM